MGKASSYSPDETNRVNYKNGDYWTLCLNGKWRDLGSGSDGSGYIMIQFDKDIKAGDIIHLTGYINNHNDSKEASIYFHRGFSTEGFADDYIFDVKDNIGNGGKVTTHSFVIPENMGDNILMTRKKAETNIYLVKVSITRPVSNIVINEANFPDANFRDYLSNMPFGKDGVITESEIKDIKELDIVARNISDLQGIEFFTALKRLNCNGNKISSLDVSKNTALTHLYCYGNSINGNNMDNLVSSLPVQDYAEFWVYNSDDEDEKNVCTTIQVQQANAKGWVVGYIKDEKGYIYHGSDPAAVENITVDNNEIAEVYTFDGKRIGSIQKGLNIIKMKDGTTRKIIVR